MTRDASNPGMCRHLMCWIGRKVSTSTSYGRVSTAVIVMASLASITIVYGCVVVPSQFGLAFIPRGEVPAVL